MDGPLTQTLPMRRPFWRESNFWLLLAISSFLYLARLTTLPVCGEESRWATSAREMIATGDWIVPRQQGEVFPERPPLGTWLMALAGLMLGEVNAWAIRLPSAAACVAMALVVYVYARHWLGPGGGLLAGLVWSTLGQVLQIGRLGESEAVFTCLLGSALLLWHLSLDQGRTWRGWLLGYGLIALAALVKGPQAPVYFVLVTCVVLWRQRDSRLFSLAHVSGIFTFAAIILAWLVPFWLRTDLNAVVAIWCGLAGDRFNLGGLLQHLVSYPLETLGCLLPWSLGLLLLLRPREARLSASRREMVSFLIWAVALTYPSVLLASGARGRYFMPLYPCLAILFAQLFWQVTERVGPESAALWLRIQRWTGFALVVVAAAPLLVGPFLKIGLKEAPPEFQVWPPFWAGLCGLLVWSLASSTARERAYVCMALAWGLIAIGPWTDFRCAQCTDLTSAAQKAHQIVPASEPLISLGPLAHRFVYFYGSPIEQHDWPVDSQSAPPPGTYFCFDRHRGDTPEHRANGRGRVWSSTPGTLPFEWESVLEIPCDPRLRGEPDVTVVIGRVRGTEAASTQREAAAQF